MAEHRISIDIEFHEKLTAEQIKELQRTVTEAISTHKQLGKVYRDVIVETQKHTRELVKQDRTWRGLVWTIVRAEIVYRGIMRIVHAVTDAFKEGAKAIEDHKMAVISLAAVETSHLASVINQQKILATAYQVNKRRAEEVYKTVQLLAAQTPLTGEQMMKLARAFAAYGQTLDLHNKKAREGILALANAIAVLTQGQRINLQIFQETRALLTGVGIQYSEVVRSVAQGNPVLMEQIKYWARTGELIYHLSDILAGFKYAARDVQQTITGLSTTLKSLFKLQIVEPAFKPFYDTLTKTLDKLIHRFFKVKDGMIELTEEGKKLKAVLESIAIAASHVVTAFEKVSRHWDVILEISTILGGLASINLGAKIIKGGFGLIVGGFNVLIQTLELVGKGFITAASAAKPLLSVIDSLYESIRTLFVATTEYEIAMTAAAESAISLTATISLVGTGIAALTATLIYAITHWKEFKETLLEVGEAHKEVAEDIGNLWAYGITGDDTWIKNEQIRFKKHKDLLEEYRNSLSKLYTDIEEQLRKTQAATQQSQLILGKSGLFKETISVSISERIKETEALIAENTKKIAEYSQKILDLKKKIATVSDKNKKDLLEELKLDEEKVKTLKQENEKLYQYKELLKLAAKYQQVNKNYKSESIKITEKYNQLIEQINNKLKVASTETERIYLRYERTTAELKKQYDIYTNQIQNYKSLRDELIKYERSALLTDKQREALKQKEKEIDEKINSILEKREKIKERIYSKEADVVNKLKEHYRTLTKDLIPIDEKVTDIINKIKELRSFKDLKINIGVNISEAIEKYKQLAKKTVEQDILAPLGDILVDNASKAEDYLNRMKNTIDKLKQEGIISEAEYHRLEKGIQKIYSWMKSGLLDLIKNLTSGLKEAFQNFFEMLFNDLFRGHLRKFKDYLKALFNDIARAFAHSFAVYLSTALMSVLSNVLKGIIFPTAQQAAASNQQAGLTGLGLIGNVSKLLNSYWQTPATITEWAFDQTGWYPLGAVTDWLQQNPWASAGLMGGLTTYLRTGSWERSLISGATTAIGYHFFGPVGGLAGNILGDVVSDVFGIGKKKKKKPEFHILEGFGTYEISMDQALSGAYSIRPDMDHGKDEKETERKVQNAYKQIVTNIVKDWMDFAKQMDTQFGTTWEEAFKQYQITLYEHNWKGKDIGEEIEEYLKKGLPKEIIPQFMEFTKEQLQAYAADAEKFNEWINSYMEAIQNASSEEEIQQVYDLFKEDISNTMAAIENFNNYLKNTISDFGKQVYTMTMNWEDAVKRLEQRGLLSEDLGQKAIDAYQHTLTTMLQQQLGLYDATQAQIERFQQLYPQIWDTIQNLHLGWEDLYNILIHLEDYYPVLKQVAEANGMTVEELIAELSNLTVALKETADSVEETYNRIMNLAQKAYQLNVISAKEYKDLEYDYWAHKLQQAGIPVTAEDLATFYSNPNYVSQIIHDAAYGGFWSEDQIETALEYLSWLRQQPSEEKYIPQFEQLLQQQSLYYYTDILGKKESAYWKDLWYSYRESVDWNKASAEEYDKVAQYAYNYYQSRLNELEEEYNKWKQLKERVQDIIEKHRDWDADRSLLDQIPHLVGRSLEDVEKYVAELDSWLSKAEEAYRRLQDYRKALSERIASVREEAQLYGKSTEERISYFSQKITAGLQQLWAIQDPDKLLEKAREVETLVLERWNLEKQRAEELKRTAEDLKQVIEDIGRAIDDLKGQLVWATPETRFQMQTAKYTELYQKALTGKPEAVREYMSFVSQYLESARGVSATAEEYGDIQAKVLSDLYELQKVTSDKQTSMEQQIKAAIDLAKNQTVSTLKQIHSVVGAKAEVLKDKIEQQTEILKKLLGNDGIISKKLTDIKQSMFNTLQQLENFIAGLKWITQSQKQTVGYTQRLATRHYYQSSSYSGEGFSYSYTYSYYTQEPVTLTHAEVTKETGTGGFAALATGGIVSEPTVTLLGEGDKPEAVVPLPYGEKTMDILFAKLARLEAENKELMKENRELRMELKGAIYQLAKYMQKTSYTLEKWDMNGMPQQEQQEKQQQAEAS